MENLEELASSLARELEQQTAALKRAQEIRIDFRNLLQEVEDWLSEAEGKVTDKVTDIEEDLEKNKVSISKQDRFLSVCYDFSF